MTQRANEIAAQIKSWNRQSIATLLGMLSELDAECTEHELDRQAYVNMSMLPSAPIPDDVDTSYPIWAIDEQGEMLIGAAADDTMTLAEYREEMARSE